MNNSVLSTLDDGILLVTINRPEKLNALNTDVIDGLSEILGQAAANDDVKTILITGAGEKSFVAGADISQFPHMNGSDGRKLALHGQQAVFDRIEHFTKPVIAAVNGFALGGGCELAMACHLRLASDNAKFGQPEVNLGLIPGYGGTQRLVHLVGKGKAMELCMTGALIGAQEALQLGLVNHVTTQDELIPKAKNLLKEIQQKAPIAIRSVISLVNQAVYEPANGLNAEIEKFGALFDTADAKEGTRAFLEKRKPVFTGR